MEMILAAFIAGTFYLYRTLTRLDLEARRSVSRGLREGDGCCDSDPFPRGLQEGGRVL
jgi:hypothetical protein